jgi:polysaccharide export outer membrane protein
MRNRILFLALLVLASCPRFLCAATQAGETFVRDYRIGPKDLLVINVFEVPELKEFTVRVSEDGSITLPYLQSVKVDGLTKDELEIRLASLLEKYVKKAQVSIFIKEYQSKRVAVIGAVNKPGMYELVGRVNVLQMITQAGGLAENAANEIVIQRESRNGFGAGLTIDLEELMTKGNQKLNVPLQPNDVVTVPVDKIINIYVMGQVKSPGALEVKMSAKITLLQAIAKAGGLTEAASKRNIMITRKDKSGRETKIKNLNLNDIMKGKKPNPILQEGDVVYVPESIF